jgi:hypothetical protein
VVNVRAHNVVGGGDAGEVMFNMAADVGDLVPPRGEGRGLMEKIRD